MRHRDRLWFEFDIFSIDPSPRVWCAGRRLLTVRPSDWKANEIWSGRSSSMRWTEWEILKLKRREFHVGCHYSRLEQLFIDANYLPVSLAAKLDFAGPPIEALNADR